MNGRFKFRAWDNFAKCFADRVLLSDDGHAYSLVGDELHGESDIIIEQCTGVKDKNGRMIYEGDVVTIDDYTWKLPVIWKKGCFWFFDSSGSGFVASSCRNNIVEIIGNIHENPELTREENNEENI